MSQFETEDMYDLTRVAQVTVSPDGSRVAFVAQEYDPAEDETRSSLFVTPTDGSQEPHRLTRASDAGNPKWSPDGTRLAFIGARETDVERKVGRDPDEKESEPRDEGASNETTGAESGDPDGEADEAADEATEDDVEDDEAREDNSKDNEATETDGEDEGAVSGGDGEPKPQVWLFDLARGGDAIQVTDRGEGVNEFDWGPDGERIVIAARDPTEEQRESVQDRRKGGPIEIERLQHKADGVGWLDDVTTYLFVVDIETGESYRLDDAYGQGSTEPHYGLEPAWGPTGRIAFGSNRLDRPDDSAVRDIYTIDPAGERLKKITDSELFTRSYKWSPDGERLCFVTNDPVNWYKPSAVHVAAPAADDPSHWSVTGSMDRTVWLLSEPTWVDNSTIVVPLGDEGQTRLVRADAERDSPERVFDTQGRDRDLPTIDSGGETLAVVLSDPNAGRDIFTIQADDLDVPDPDSLTQVTALNESLLAGRELPGCRRIIYANSEGEEIEAIVHLPPDFEPETDEPRPVIASIHGGPMAYDSPGFEFRYTFWADQGYVVYRPNYRGSTSYGRAFAESLKGQRGDMETDDVLSGLYELADRGWIDPDRSMVTGFSYGGITTAHIVTRTDEFSAAAPEHGIYDYRSLFGTDDSHLWQEWEFGLPWENPELTEEISSITDVDQIETPMLITAGEEDWRCPPTQAEQLYVSLRKRDVPAKLVIYQNEHHNVSDPDRAIHRLEVLKEWFEEHALEDTAGDSEEAASE